MAKPSLLLQAAEVRRARAHFLLAARRAAAMMRLAPPPRFIGGRDEPTMDLLAEDDFLSTLWTKREGLLPIIVVSVRHARKCYALLPNLNPALRN